MRGREPMPVRQKFSFIYPERAVVLPPAHHRTGQRLHALSPGAGLPSRNAVCLADNSRYYLRLAKATDKAGKTGIWKMVKGNLAVINTGESALP